MKCQHCKENEASVSLHYNYKGREGEMHLCGRCAREMYGKYISAMEDTLPRPLRGLGRRNAEAASPPALYASESIKTRRRLSALRAKMSKAVREENYEEAARLRDEISILEQEGCTYDTQR